jgi:hypothetical protein
MDNSDEFLRRHQIMHLYLGGAGSDAVLYPIQYPEVVLLLGADGNVHLEDDPPGKRFMVLGRRKLEKQLNAEIAARAGAIRVPRQPPHDEEVARNRTATADSPNYRILLANL